MPIKTIRDLFSSKPNVNPISNTQTTNNRATQSGDRTQTNIGSQTGSMSSMQDSLARRTGMGTQVTGLQDQSLLGPLRGLLSQVQGGTTADQRIARDTLTQALVGEGAAGTPSGYSADRRQVLQDAANAGRLINSNLASSGLSGNAGAGTRMRSDLQDRTQRNLLDAYDRNRSTQLQNISQLAQTAQGIGEQQRLAPLSTAAGYGAALSPFSREGTTDQSTTDQSTTTGRQQSQQDTRSTLRELFENLQKGSQTTTGEQDHVGPSNLQNLLGLLGGIGGVVGAFKGN